MNSTGAGSAETTAASASSALDTAAVLAKQFLAGLSRRPVHATASVPELSKRLGQTLGEEGVPPETVVAELASAAEPGLVASAGPRYFGFVIGGSHPAAVGADWLTSAWDQ